MRFRLTLLILGIATVLCADRSLVSWEFHRDGDTLGWQPNASVREVAVREGALQGYTTPNDPILVGPLIHLKPSPFQYVEIRARSDRSGTGELFWANTTQEPYGGFRPGKQLAFQAIGDGRWHLYRLFPFWQSEGQILRLRLDPPDDARIAIDYVRIGELEPASGWRWVDLRGNDASPPRRVFLSPPLQIKARETGWAAIRIWAKRGDSGQFLWAGDSNWGTGSLPLNLRPDGKWHTLNLRLTDSDLWKGRVLAAGVSFPPDAQVEVAAVRFARRPQGSSELRIARFFVDDPINRVGQKVGITAWIGNVGGATSPQAFARLSVKGGLRFESSPTIRIPPLAYSDTHKVHWRLRAERSTRTQVSLLLSASSLSPEKANLRIEIGPKLSVRPACLPDGRRYVPPPHPVHGDYEVGVYYFPGWKTYSRWQVLDNFPERYPVMGYYREGDPEVADWHIKWAVEHGITFFAYDWYWSAGARSLEHALHQGYLKARYRKYLKFCLLWANHNPPKTSSEEDLLKVTDYWIEHYFRLPEYYTIAGKPVVILFSPYRLTEDMGPEAVRRAFEKMRARCQEKGLPGLYLIACSGTGTGELTRLKAEGYDAVSGYNYPTAGIPAGERRYPYDAMIRGYEEIWNAIAGANILPYIAVTAPGWDSRPWHGEAALVRTGSTPAKMKQMLMKARQFTDRHWKEIGQKVVLVEAWNEWGEGDYIEPHRQFGFGYLEAIRDVFAPTHNPPPPVTLRDVGLGPYTLTPPKRTLNWVFRKDGAFLGWDGVYNIQDHTVRGGTMRGTAINNDPAFLSPPVEIDSARYRHIIVHMRMDQGGKGQLFWTTLTSPESEANSIRFPVSGDGQWHTYRLDVGASPNWRGKIVRLRLDPNDHAGSHIEIAQIQVTK